MKTTLITAAAALALSAFSASAQVWVSGDSTGTAPSNDTAIGYSFTISNAFSITQLGAFDGGDGLSGTAQVRVWQDQSGTWVNIGGADALGGASVGNYSFVSAPPSLTGLPAGSYILSVWYAGADLHGDTSLGDGNGTFSSISGLTLGAIMTASVSGDQRPDTTYGNGIKGPNMNVTVVPEPETYALIAGLGLLGFGLYRRQARG